MEPLRSEDGEAVGVNPFAAVADAEPERVLTVADRVRERLANEDRSRRVAAQIAREKLLQLVDAPRPPKGLTRLSSRATEPLVYLVQGEGGGPVKIGKALDYALRARLTGLQIGNPETLVVRRLLYGGDALEALLQVECNDWHVRGEWFRDEGFVAELIRPDGVLRSVFEGC